MCKMKQNKPVYINATRTCIKIASTVPNIFNYNQFPMFLANQALQSR